MYNITENDYEFFDVPDEYYGVRIKTGEFKDVCVQYGTVTVHEDEQTGDGILKFDYDVISEDDHLKGDNAFEIYVGQILQHIIIGALESGDYKVGNKNESAVNSDDNPA